ncbi:MAG: ABC-F family ATP-binding cassette domain-containing protein [Spirochaetales bacterium]
MSLITIENLSHSFGDKVIFNNANLVLFNKEKMGLVGLNGTGKSTLIKMIIGELIYDKGSITIHPKAKLGFLDQHAEIKSSKTIMNYLREAYSKLYEIDEKFKKVNEKLATVTDENEMMELLEESSNYFEYLDASGFYNTDSEIEKVASGLGITAFGLDTPVKHLSGGQRAKVMLAKLLLDTPDILVLDEPTNFLDVAHIDWLTKYLNAFEGAAIIVSHDTKFLDSVTTCIADIENNKITRYNLKFDKFLEEKGLRADQYRAEYEKQQKYIAKLEDFIARNIARASTSNMAKSRRKTLEKLDVLDKPTTHQKPFFKFTYRPIGSKILLEVEDLEIGYSKSLLPPINITIEKGEKLAIQGFNGIGKTTFLKTLSGIIPAIKGTFKFATAVKIEYFEQDNTFHNDEQTPLEFMRGEFPLMTDGEIRTALAKCGLKQKHIVTQLKRLSGGEQAKTTLCKLCLKPANVLILDEPTNHLDIDAVEALKAAIAEYEGSILFVSHSKDFVAEVADKVLNMEELLSKKTI